MAAGRAAAAVGAGAGVGTGATGSWRCRSWHWPRCGHGRRHRCGAGAATGSGKAVWAWLGCRGSGTVKGKAIGGKGSGRVTSTGASKASASSCTLGGSSGTPPPAVFRVYGAHQFRLGAPHDSRSEGGGSVMGWLVPVFRRWPWVSRCAQARQAWAGAQCPPGRRCGWGGFWPLARDLEPPGSQLDEPQQGHMARRPAGRDRRPEGGLQDERERVTANVGAAANKAGQTWNASHARQGDCVGPRFPP